MRSRGPLGRSTVLVAVMMLMTALTAAAASAATPAPAATRATNLCQTAVDRTDATVGPTAGQTKVQGLRVGQHEDATPRYDRVVVDLVSPLRNYQVRYVPQIFADGSGDLVNLGGNANLYVRLDATGHDDNGHGTITTPTDQVVNWGSLREARLVGDFEGVVTFGIGLSASTDYVVSTLTNPNRLVIDVAMPGQHPWVCNSGAVKVYFFDPARFTANVEPYTTPVWRRVETPAVAGGALHAMFRGPTATETNSGLQFWSSSAWGFSNLSITNGIARVRLTFGCDSGGSTFSIAGEIFPTLKQFSSVQWVKIYDPAGNTGVPNGPTDSIPDCLNP